jgi:hypothetical protein
MLPSFKAKGHTFSRTAPWLPAFGLLAFGLLAGCSLPAQPPAGPAVAANPAPVVPPPPPPPPPPSLERVYLGPVLAFADRVRNLQGAELAQEIARLGEPPQPADQLRLALALSQTRQLYDLVRAQELLQRVLANAGDEARPLHPLARLLAARLGEQRRVEDQLDRQNQQQRELQRRLTETQEKLDALKEIERSLTNRPPAAAPATPASSATSSRARARPPTP